MTASSLPRVLLLTGAAAWFGVCLATLLSAESGPRLIAWAFASVIFIVSFTRNARAGTVSLVALGLQSASVVTMVALLCNGYEGLLLVLIAAQLATHDNNRLGLAWIAAQTLSLGIAIAVHWTPRASLLLTPPYLGFQILMFAAVRLFVEERRTSDRLTAANDTLQRLQSALAQKTRIEERLRIAHDMHDVLGHHLTALSLNLELAAHESAGTARTTIRTAQSLARALLCDIKTLVRSASDEVPVDLQHELKQLANELLSPKLHISCASDLRIADVRTSRALFRVVQEIVTNAIRHGEAQNLWIRIEHTAARVSLVARDDGRAGACIVEGFGLSGMRRRLEELGGTLSAAPCTSGGFEVRAELSYTRDAGA